MSIILIDNQTIRFRLLTEIEAESCDCSVKPYCQMVNKFDASKFQIISNTIITNGDFSNELTGWDILEPISATTVITNETSAGACDGEIVITATGGTPAYTYSIDGVTFQGSSTFSNLCTDCYTIIIKDSLGNLGFKLSCVDTNIICGDYAASELFDLKSLNTSTMLNCYLNDFI